MSQRESYRWPPLTGVVFVALMVIAFIVAGESPSNDDSNAEITAYLVDGSEQDKNIIGFILLMVATLFLVAFFAALRSRLVRAEGDIGRLGHLAFGAGVASAVLLFIGVSAFIAPILTADDASRFPPEPSDFRMMQTLGYMLWVGSTFIAALAMWATSAVVLRTGTLPRWFGWFSLVTGVIALVAIFFVPMFVYWLWILVAAILMWTKPGRESEGTIGPAETTT